MATPEKISIPQSAEDISLCWVQQVLQKDLPGVTITAVDVKGFICEGEGHLSDIIAFDAVGLMNGTSQRYSIVAKLTNFTKPLELFGKDYPTALQIRLETTEVEFYSSVVPELLSVMVPSTDRDLHHQDRPPVDSSPVFLPKCYFAATDPSRSSMVSVRVMENLKTQGFSIKPDRQPLNREEMMLAAGALAQFHGLSHRLELRSGVPLSKKYDHSVISESGMLSMDKDYIGGYVYGVKLLEDAFPDQTDLVARLKKLDAKSVFADVEKSPRLKVLSHTDCWVNNIMIKYDGDVPTEVKLVDWQLIQYLPPTCDLACLFLCSTTWDVFHNHRDAILSHYHQHLRKTLGPNESLGLQCYTLEQLKADFQADSLYGVVCRLIRLVILPADQDLLKIVQEIQKWGVI